MKLAFLILAHKSPRQLERLADYLSADDCRVFVHVDRKTASQFRNLFQKYDGNSRVLFFSKFNVYWGSYNQIRASFFLLGKALENSDFDFVSLISAQDLPVKPIREFSRYLSGFRNKSFVRHHPVPYTGFEGNGGLDRIELFWILNFNKRLGFFFNKLNVLIHTFQHTTEIKKKLHLSLHGGHNWFTLNREMAAYVTDFLNRNGAFLKKFRFSRCADELILQTILLNSEHADNIINDSLRLIDWYSGPEYPKVFRLADESELLSTPAFFARKFDDSVDDNIINSVYDRI